MVVMLGFGSLEGRCARVCSFLVGFSEPFQSICNEGCSQVMPILKKSMLFENIYFILNSTLYLISIFIISFNVLEIAKDQIS